MAWPEVQGHFRAMACQLASSLAVLLGKCTDTHHKEGPGSAGYNSSAAKFVMVRDSDTSVTIVSRGKGWSKADTRNEKG